MMVMMVSVLHTPLQIKCYQIISILVPMPKTWTGNLLGPGCIGMFGGWIFRAAVFTCWCTIIRTQPSARGITVLRQAVRAHWLVGETENNNKTAREGQGGNMGARDSSGERGCNWCIASAVIFVTEFLTGFYWLVTLRYVGKLTVEQFSRLSI